MAGHILSQMVQPARPRISFARRNVVEASVSILGSTYTTLMREGASAEELIEKVARENGGGVAKVYYPEFRTWEIVAVKIGGQLLVKGDPKKVAEADFSHFGDPEALKALAISYSEKSEGGIHFSIGSSGIPLAVTENQGIVFPNAGELKVGRGTSNIALWMTSVNINPQTMAELDRAYSSRGGISLSPDALKKISESHGGVRSGRLILDDNILVLNKDTGELTAVSHSQPIDKPAVPAETVFFAPIPLPGPQQLAVDACRLDAFRIPYLSVIRFDGSISEHVRVSLPLGLPAGKRPPATQEAGQTQKLRFSVLEFRQGSPEPELARQAPAPAAKGEAENPGGAPVSAPASPGLIKPGEPGHQEALRQFLRPRTGRIFLGFQPAPGELPSGPKRKKKRKERVALSGGPDPGIAQDGMPRVILPAENPARRNRARRKTADAGQRQGQGKKRKSKPTSPLAQGPREGKRPKLPARGITLESVRAMARAAVKRLRMERASQTKQAPVLPLKRKPKKAERKPAPRAGPRAAAAKSPKLRQEAIVKSKRKMSRYFLYELLGLFQRKRRGRKLRTKNSRAE